MITQPHVRELDLGISFLDCDAGASTMTVGWVQQMIQAHHKADHGIRLQYSEAKYTTFCSQSPVSSPSTLLNSLREF